MRGPGLLHAVKAESRLLRCAALSLIAFVGCRQAPEPVAIQAALNDDAGPNCVPISCKEAGANCGQVADGCGGTLLCGSCSEPEVCGGLGKPNVCAARECEWLKLLGCHSDEDLQKAAIKGCLKRGMDLNSHSVGRACGADSYDGAEYQCCKPKAK